MRLRTERDGHVSSPACSPPPPHELFSSGAGAPRGVALRRQARLLPVLVRCITSVALVAAAFGPAYSHLALLLLYGRRWADTEAPLALGLYSWYLVPLAANGILEAFLHSVADERQLHASNAALVAFTAAHACLSAAAGRCGGAAGLIGADAVNMVLRIAYCLVFARRRFGGGDSSAGDGGGSNGSSKVDGAALEPGFSLRGLLPSAATAAALAAAAALTGASRVLLMSGSSALAAAAAQRGLSVLPPAAASALSGQPFAALAAAHVGVGIACLAAVAATMWRHERQLLTEVRQLRKGSKAA